MRVQMTSAIAGRPSYMPGEIVDLEPRIARAWIADGLAMALRDELVDTTEAVAVGVEMAATTPRRRRAV